MVARERATGAVRPKKGTFGRASFPTQTDVKKVIEQLGVAWELLSFFFLSFFFLSSSPCDFHRPPACVAVDMSAIIGGWIGKLFLPNPASRLPSAPGFPPQPLRLTTPTPTDQGSTSTKRSRNAAISALDKLRKEFVGDVGCFLTGYSCISLEVAHLVNAVRKKGGEARKAEVASPLLFYRRQPLTMVYPPDQAFNHCLGHYSSARRL